MKNNTVKKIKTNSPRLTTADKRAHQNLRNQRRNRLKCIVIVEGV